ncbi:uncharacterized protein EI97DRAFT_457343 [Westerdykella ornata]|uniref:Uncharacterized protein n=1 Tax=Westerdykella ornata TaxID=318751 RepID=A0A6A6JM58_WESOR|nr:uncharacterized protein EI97DRAFT_457343 [Westerdykella ornata]KAF2277315.1 hypothetical protein EI97DRAFT_457343 [Westerdykella ornata]
MCLYWRKQYTCGCVSHIFRDRCADNVRSGSEKCENTSDEEQLRSSYFQCFTCLVLEDREEKAAAAAAGMHINEWRRRKALQERARKRQEEERMARRKTEEERKEMEMQARAEAEATEKHVGNDETVTQTDSKAGLEKAGNEKEEEEKLRRQRDIETEQEKIKSDEGVWTDVGAGRKGRRWRDLKTDASPPASSVAASPSTMMPLSVENPSSATPPFSSATMPPSSTKPSSSATMSSSNPKPYSSPTMAHSNPKPSSSATMSSSAPKGSSSVTMSAPTPKASSRPSSIAMPPRVSLAELSIAMAEEFGLPLRTPSPTVIMPSSPASFYPEKAPGEFFGPPVSATNGRSVQGTAGPAQHQPSITSENRRDGVPKWKKRSLNVAQQTEGIVMPDLSLFPGEDNVGPTNSINENDKVSDKSNPKGKGKANVKYRLSSSSNQKRSPFSSETNLKEQKVMPPRTQVGAGGTVSESAYPPRKYVCPGRRIQEFNG